MRFGRFTSGESAPFWGVVDRQSEVEGIEGALASWAPSVIDGGIGDLPLTGDRRRLADLTLLAPFESPGRVFACGANYWEHLRSAGFMDAPPKVPVAYLKVDTSIIGPGVPIRYPSFTNQLDYEVELVAVIGRPLVPGRPPSESLLGYTVGNDVSIRDTDDPFGAPDLYAMKAPDGISPVGPWIVTADELGPGGQPSLVISLLVNGEIRQEESTGNVIFPIDDLLAYVNDRNALRAGDILFTGTPHGTAAEGPDGRFLEPGDVVQAQIEGIGVLCNTVADRDADVPPDSVGG